jgi:hypothetical protein
MLERPLWSRCRPVFGCVLITILFFTVAHGAPARGKRRQWHGQPNAFIIYGVEFPEAEGDAPAPDEIRQGYRRGYDEGCFSYLKSQGLKPIRYRNIVEFVNKVLERIGPAGVIKELHLHGHGRPGEFGFGIGKSPDMEHRPFTYAGHRSWNAGAEHWKFMFHRLIGRFAPNAIIELRGCNTGADSDRFHGSRFLFELAHYFKATVCAPVELILPPVYVYKGEWQQATPDMTEPPKPKHSTGLLPVRDLRPLAKYGHPITMECCCGNSTRCLR